jgi:GTP pyrophosphokinase
VARELGHPNIDAMLQALAYGKIHGRDVARALGAKDEEAPKPTLLRRVLSLGREPQSVKVGGMDQVLVRFAKCCSPVYGDPVEGFITRGRGVTVHTRDCPKVFHLDPERRVPVTWEGEHGPLGRVKVRVVSEDRPGLLAAITKMISGEGVNIQAGQITTSANNRAVQTFDLSVRDRKHLDNVIKQLSKIRGVLSVERVRS